MGLRFEGIDVAYGSKRVLADLWLDVPDGAVTGFLGHNGAGKTTAMRVALGLVRPRAGRVLVDGFDVARHPREARARMGGLIEVCRFQEGLGGWQNLVELARLGGLSRADAHREASRLLEQVGLVQAAHKPVGAYSQGMRQRLGIAQALVGAPRVLMLDEPTNGLDPEGISDVRALVRELVEREGRAVLLSSHLLAELAGVCDRVAVLKDGHLVVEGARAALLSSGGERYRVEVESFERAEAAARGLGLALVGRANGATHAHFRVELGERRPADVARAFVDAGLVAFSPEPEDLATLYRRASAGELPAPARGVADEARTPEQSRAPRRPLTRLVGYDARRLVRAGALALLIAPASLAAFAVWRRMASARELADDVAGGRLATTTDVSAFEALGRGLAVGLPVAALVVLGLASQLVAAEHARGTLRNVLLRPVGRLRAALGKGLVAAGAALFAFAALLAVTWGLAAFWFDFGDVSEILPNGERFPIVPAEELWPELRTALFGAPLPLLAYAGLGLLVGALVRTAAGALAAALGLAVALDLLRAFAREGGWEVLLPATYLPSPLADSSAVRSFALLAEGVTNAPFQHASGAVVVPLAWAMVGLLGACLSMSRRDVP